MQLVCRSAVVLNSTYDWLKDTCDHTIEKEYTLINIINVFYFKKKTKKNKNNLLIELSVGC